MTAKNVLIGRYLHTVIPDSKITQLTLLITPENKHVNGNRSIIRIRLQLNSVLS